MVDFLDEMLNETSDMSFFCFYYKQVLGTRPSQCVVEYVLSEPLCRYFANVIGLITLTIAPFCGDATHVTFTLKSWPRKNALVSRKEGAGDLVP